MDQGLKIIHKGKVLDPPPPHKTTTPISPALSLTDRSNQLLEISRLEWTTNNKASLFVVGTRNESQVLGRPTEKSYGSITSEITPSLTNRRHPSASPLSWRIITSTVYNIKSTCCPREACPLTSSNAAETTDVWKQSNTQRGNKRPQQTKRTMPLLPSTRPQRGKRWRILDGRPGGERVEI